MKHRIFHCLVPLLLAVPAAHATTISLSDFSGSGATFVENRVLMEDGSPLVVGQTLVRVGFFTDLSTDVLEDLASPDRDTVFDALDTYFVGLGEGRDSDLGTPASGGPRVVQRTVNGSPQQGRLFGNINSVNPGVYNPPDTVTGVPEGTQVFVLVYDTSSAATATELGIFSADDASWTMPADPLLNVTLNTTLVNTPGEIYRGKPGSIMLAALVPEPATSLFALGALAGGMLRRRR